MFDHFSIAIGKYWVYKSPKSHWFFPWTDSAGSSMISIGYLKVIRYPHAKYNPGQIEGFRIF